MKNVENYWKNKMELLSLPVLKRWVLDGSRPVATKLKVAIAVIVLTAVAGASFFIGRLSAPKQDVLVEQRIVERVVVQQRTVLSVKTRVKNNTRIVTERVVLNDGTVVERSVATDKTVSESDTTVKNEVKLDAKQDVKVVERPNSSVDLLLGTNLALVPHVGLELTTRVGPARVGAWGLVPVTKPLDTAVGVSVGVEF